MNLVLDGRLRGWTVLGLSGKPFEPELMEPRHAVRKEAGAKPCGPAVLGLFGDDVRARGSCADEPCMVGVDADSERAPGDSGWRSELEHGGTNCDAESAPGEYGVLMKVDSGNAVEAYIVGVRIPR